MKCSKCGADIFPEARFCPKCGQKTLSEKRTIQLKCKSCGGTLTIDKDQPILCCPFCQANELIVESDDVTIQRIKSNTYKDVELEKLKLEEARERRQIEREREQEAQKRAYNRRFSKLAKFSLVFAIICLLLFVPLALFGSNMLLKIIAIAQVVLFFLAWATGRRNGYGTTRAKHKLFAILGFLLIAAFLAAMNMRIDLPLSRTPKAPSPTIPPNAVTDESAGIYTYQIRDYVGKNLASVGELYGGQCTDEYGHGGIDITFVSEDGIFLNPQNEDQLKEYVVKAQSILAGSDITLVHDRADNGEPYPYSVDFQSIEEIILYANKLGNESANEPRIVNIKPTSDRHTWYIRDYVDRNAAACGEKRGVDRFDAYGEGRVRLVFTAEDGSYVDTENLNILQQYVVTSQDVEPNSELTFVFQKNDYGEEYPYSIQSQSIEEINLTVRRLDDSIIASLPTIPVNTVNPNESEETATSVTTATPAPTDIPDVSDETDVEPITYKRGSKGDEVMQIQARLIELGYLSGSADGDYGNKTKVAVEMFEDAIGFEITGEVDEYVWEELFSEYAPIAKTEEPTQKPTSKPTQKPQAKSGIRSEVKSALDSYEDFFDEYIEFMESYSESSSDIGAILKYTQLLTQYAEMIEKLEAFDEAEDLTDEELAYYIQVQTRINGKLAAMTIN